MLKRAEGRNRNPGMQRHPKQSQQSSLESKPPASHLSRAWVRLESWFLPVHQIPVLVEERCVDECPPWPTLLLLWRAARARALRTLFPVLCSLGVLHSFQAWLSQAGAPVSLSHVSLGWSWAASPLLQLLGALEQGAFQSSCSFLL